MAGPACQLDIDECVSFGAQPPCANGATCINTFASFQCICVNGWTGDDCSVNIDDCAVGVERCHNGGTCHDRVGSFHCECPAGKTGLLCHLDDACASNPCRYGEYADSRRHLVFNTLTNAMSLSRRRRVRHVARRRQLRLLVSARIQGHLVRTGHQRMCRSGKSVRTRRRLPQHARLVQVPLSARFHWYVSLSLLPFSLSSFLIIIN